MKRAFLALATCLAFATICAAQQPSADSPATKEDVERYLQVMQSRDRINKVVDAMTGTMHQMFHGECMKDKDKLPSDCEETENKMLDEEMRSFPWDQMLEAMVPIYQKHYTEGDINALIAFYSTPTGEKVLNEGPAITAEAMQTMMPIIEKQLGAIQERIQEKTAQMMKESEAKPGQNSKATPN